MKMKSKFILPVCALAAAFVFCSCSKEGGANKPAPTASPVPIYSLMPADILTADNLSSIITYTPVCDNLSDTPTEKAILYRSEPMGKDPVKIEVMQYSADFAKANVKAKYDADKALRPSGEELALEGGFEGYIAFPYAKIYYDGYYVTITAGSGNNDEQKQLLKNAADMAAGNLKNLLSAGSDSSAAGGGESALKVVSGN